MANGRHAQVVQGGRRRGAVAASIISLLLMVPALVSLGILSMRLPLASAEAETAFGDVPSTIYQSYDNTPVGTTYFRWSRSSGDQQAYWGYDGWVPSGNGYMYCGDFHAFLPGGPGKNSFSNPKKPSEFYGSNSTAYYIRKNADYLDYIVYHGYGGADPISGITPAGTAHAIWWCTEEAEGRGIGGGAEGRLASGASEYVRNGANGPEKGCARVYVCNGNNYSQQVMILGIFGKGDLKIEKNVTVNAPSLGSTQREFTFVVTLPDSDTHTYSGSRSGTIASGGTITLKHGESVTIKDVSSGSYTIRETGASGWTMTGSGISGGIKSASTVTAHADNEYSCHGTWVPAKVRKTISNRSLEELRFSFVLKDRDSGTVIETIKTDDLGNAQFKTLTYGNEDHNKTHRYQVYEVIPAAATQQANGTYLYRGITYDPHKVNIDILTKDKGDGTMTVTKTETVVDARTDKAVSAPYLWENEYHCEGFHKPTAKKFMEGAPLTANQFAFEVHAGSPTGAIVTTGRNDASGNVTFTPDIRFTEADAGTSKIYYMVEKDEHDRAIVYDDSTKVIILTPKDNGDGTMTVTSVYPDGKDFVNELAPGELEIKKTVDGNPRTKETAKFYFKVTFTKGDGTADTGIYPYTGYDGAGSGMIRSGGIVTLLHGERVVIEGIPHGTAYKVTEVDLPGGYSEKSRQGDEGTIAGGETSTAEWVNGYAATGSAQVVAYKVVKGSDAVPEVEAKAGEYTFDLYDSGGQVIQTKTNDGTGDVVFDPIQFTDQDVGSTYRYTVKERPGSLPKISKYSTLTAYYSVTVADNGDGTLSCPAVITDASGTPVTSNPTQSATFVNEPSPGELKVTKTTDDPSRDVNEFFEFDVTLTNAAGFDLPTDLTHGEPVRITTVGGESVGGEPVLVTESATPEAEAQPEAIDVPADEGAEGDGDPVDEGEPSPEPPADIEEGPMTASSRTLTCHLNDGTDGAYGVDGTNDVFDLSVPAEWSTERIRFANWNSAPDGTGDAYDAEPSYVVPEVGDLYAQWEKLLPADGSIESLDFSSCRLIVKSQSFPSTGTVVDQGDGTYLVEFADEADTAWGFMDLRGQAEEIAPDRTFELGVDDEPVDAGTPSLLTEAVGPLMSLVTEDMGEAVAEGELPAGVADPQLADMGALDEPVAQDGSLVVLIDTAVSEHPNVVGMSSVLADGVEVSTQHGDLMVADIVAACPDARIWSIAALDADGTATAATVYAALESAIRMNPRVISMSMAMRAPSGNEMIESALREAHARGIAVVGAAGNDNTDASMYLPGRMGDEAIVVGAIDDDGQKLPASNFGDTVDVYVNRASTSHAAALVTAWVASLDGEIPTDGLAEAIADATGAVTRTGADVTIPEYDGPTPFSTGGLFGDPEGFDAMSDSFNDYSASKSAAGSGWTRRYGTWTKGTGSDSSKWWLPWDSGGYPYSSSTNAGWVAGNGVGKRFWYTFDASGWMRTGWFNDPISGYRYYLGTNGRMVNGPQTISGTSYKFARHYYSSDGAKNCTSGDVAPDNDDEAWAGNRPVGPKNISSAGTLSGGTAGALYVQVTFNANGGTVVADPANSDYQYRYSRIKYNVLPKASKTGYTFAGWYTAATDGTKVTASSAVPDTNITLYAHYTKNTYTVAYNANGGTGTTTSSTHTYDVAKKLTKNGFTRTGYTFAGWNTKVDGTGTSYSDQQSVTNLTSTANGTVTLYAQWTINRYTITFAQQTAGSVSSFSASANPSTGSTSLSALGSITAQYGATITANYTIANGYQFKNVTKTGTATITSSSATQAKIKVGAGNSTVTINVNGASYTVRFNPNGGVGSATEQEIPRAVATQLNPNPFYKFNKQFKYWTTGTADSGTHYSDRQSVTDLAAADATINLYAQWGDVTNVTKLASNKWRIRIPANSYIVITGLPAGTDYLVEEVNLDTSAWTLDPPVGAEGTIKPLERKEASFNNRKTPGSPVGYATLSATKLMDGRVPDGSHAFSFGLYDSADPNADPLQVVQNQGSEIRFSPIELTTADVGHTLTYYIREIPEDNDGIQFDSSVKTARVAVTRDGDNIRGAVTYVDGDRVFENAGAPGSIRIVKVAQSASVAPDATFTFDVKAQNGGAAVPDGTYGGVTLTNGKGTFTMTPANGQAEMLMENVPAGSVVTITEDQRSMPSGWCCIGDGTVSVTAVAHDTVLAEFTNEYAPRRNYASIDLEFSIFGKQLVNGTLSAKDFCFEVSPVVDESSHDEGGTGDDTGDTGEGDDQGGGDSGEHSGGAGGGTGGGYDHGADASLLFYNDADGKISVVLGPFDRAGTYPYRIKEIPLRQDASVSYDESIKEFDVVITEEADTHALTGAVSYDGSLLITEAQLHTIKDCFVNTALPAELTISKAVTTANAPARSFRFVVDLYDSNGMALSGQFPYSGSKSGNISSGGAIELSAGQSVTVTGLPGDGRWHVREVTYPDASQQPATGGWSVDGLDELSGALSPAEPARADFTNVYEAVGQWSPTVTKELVGAALEAGQFTFELRDSDGEIVSTATNDASGNVSFPAVEFGMDDVGTTQTFTISEHAAGDPAIEYDAHSVTYSVSVALGATEGRLSVSATRTSGEERFVNRTGSTLRVEKATTGTVPEVAADSSFTFQVALYDATGSPVTQPCPIVVTDGTGATRSSGTISHNGTFLLRAGWAATITGLPAFASYDVVEATAPGWSLEASENATGSLPANRVTTATFTNAYYSSGEWVPKGIKIWDGLDTDNLMDVFHFELLDSTGQVISTGYTYEDRTLRFAGVPIDAPGTYTYKMREVQSNEVYPYVEYDTAEKPITVSAVDDGQGTIVCTVDYGSGNTQASFENKNTTAPPTGVSDGVPMAPAMGVAATTLAATAYVLVRRRSR